MPKNVADALRGVHLTDKTATEVSFGKYGGANLADFSQVIAPIVGFDTNVPYVLTVGKAPNSVSVLYGSFDPAAIGAKLQAKGYKQTDRGHGETQWLIRDDHQFGMSQDPDDILTMTLSTLNVVRVSKDRIVYGGATADLDAAVPAQGAALADDPVVGGIAKCLGSDSSGYYSSTPNPIAVGVGSDGTETLCVSAPDDATAKKYGDAFTTQVTSGTSARMYERWNKRITDPKVESLGGKAHVMRLTVKDVEPAHPILEQEFVAGDVQTLIGLPGLFGKSQPGGSSSSAPGGSATDSATAPSDSSSSSS